MKTARFWSFMCICGSTCRVDAEAMSNLHSNCIAIDLFSYGIEFGMTLFIAKKIGHIEHTREGSASADFEILLKPT